MLARVASSDCLASLPISSDLYEEIEFPSEISTAECQKVSVQVILLSTRDHMVEFRHRDELISYLESRVEYDDQYVYFQYEPDNAPRGTQCELVFRNMHQLVHFVEKFVCRTYWTTYET